MSFCYNYPLHDLLAIICERFRLWLCTLACPFAPRLVLKISIFLWVLQNTICHTLQNDLHAPLQFVIGGTHLIHGGPTSLQPSQVNVSWGAIDNIGNLAHAASISGETKYIKS